MGVGDKALEAAESAMHRLAGWHRQAFPIPDHESHGLAKSIGVVRHAHLDKDVVLLQANVGFK